MPGKRMHFQFCSAQLVTSTLHNALIITGIMPAVLRLGGKGIESLSTTRVMRYITDRTIRKEKQFFRLICDFFYRCVFAFGKLHLTLSWNNLNCIAPAITAILSQIAVLSFLWDLGCKLSSFSHVVIKMVQLGTEIEITGHIQRAPSKMSSM